MAKQSDGDDEHQRAMDASWRILGYRPQSTKELSDKLIKKGFNKSAVISAVARIKELGYLNDEEFASQRFSSLQKTGKGTDLIRLDLKKRGIDSDLIAKTIDENKLSPDEEAEHVKYIAERKLKQLKGLQPAVIYRRMGGFLARRGYSIDTVRRVLRSLLKDEEE